MKFFLGFALRGRRRGAVVTGTCLFAALLLLVGPTTAGAKKVPKGPKGKAFYETPAELPKGHGKAIWQRKAQGLVPLDGAKKNRVILYTSRSPRGERIAVSGSVHVPKGKPPKGGFPVITWANGTVGAADACAPSRNRAKSPVRDFVSYVNPELSRWLKAGYAIVRTDYAGLGTEGPHPYLNGQSEGRAVIDIALAARKVDKRIGDEFAIAGHSQGGHAALFASKVARKWSRGMDLAGTVSFAPASHLKEQAQALPALTSPSGLSALATLILYGAEVANPSLEIDSLLADGPLGFYPQLEQKCLPQLSGPDALGGFAPADLLREDAEIGPLLGTLEQANPAVRSDAPILLVQGEADSTVFKIFTDQLEGELNALGNDLTYSVYPGIGHGEIVAAGAEEAGDWLERVLPSGR